MAKAATKKLTRELDRSKAKAAKATAGASKPAASKMGQGPAAKAYRDFLTGGRQDLAAHSKASAAVVDGLRKDVAPIRVEPTSNTARRIATAASTRKMVAEGKLPGSWTSAKERALAANDKASARTVKVAERMLADPNKAAKTLEAVQRGATTAARVKAGKFGLALAAGTAIAAGVAALTSRKAKAAEPPAQSGGDRTKPYTDSLGREYKQGRKITRGTP